MRQKGEPHRRITVPRHEEIAKGTLRAILNEAGLTPEEFSKLL
jgi:predicted RNA binding protein YcfA (HicA-like mRNA interferase family)